MVNDIIPGQTDLSGEFFNGILDFCTLSLEANYRLTTAEPSRVNRRQNASFRIITGTGRWEEHRHE
jgi:hypothetical protein